MMASFLLLVFLLPSNFAVRTWDPNRQRFVDDTPAVPPPSAPYVGATGQFSNVFTSVELGSGSNFGSSMRIHSHFSSSSNSGSAPQVNSHFTAPFPPPFPHHPPPFGTQMGHNDFGFLHPPPFGTQMGPSTFGFPPLPAVIKQQPNEDDGASFTFPALQPAVMPDVMAPEPPSFEENFAKLAVSKGQDKTLAERHAYMETEALKKNKRKQKVPEANAVFQPVPKNAAAVKAKEPEAPAPNVANKSKVPHKGINRTPVVDPRTRPSVPRLPSIPPSDGRSNNVHNNSIHVDNSNTSSHIHIQTQSGSSGSGSGFRIQTQFSNNQFPYGIPPTNVTGYSYVDGNVRGRVVSVNHPNVQILHHSWKSEDHQQRETPE